MRILILHSQYLSGAASGENRVVQDEAQLLRDGGHDVQVWSPAPEQAQGLFGMLHMGFGSVWSRVALSQLRRLVNQQRPDVIHCHNLFPMLSPAILLAASGKGAAVVLTLHNYRLMCLPSTLLRNGRICEDCLGKVPWRGVMYKCYRASAQASGVLATSLTVHRALATFDRVTLFAAISEFIRNKHIEAGLPADRIRVKPHFSWRLPRRTGPGEYFLYLGRLAVEKGVDTLLEAWGPEAGRLIIVGDGPEAGRLKAMAPPQVEFKGTVSFDEVPDLISKARCLLVPSIWYEGAGRVVLEAYAAGVPVLASRMGALPEVVEDGRSGFLLPPGDPHAWADGVRRLLDDDVARRLGDQAWAFWNARHAPERGLEDLEGLYADAISRL